MNARTTFAPLFAVAALTLASSAVLAAPLGERDYNTEFSGASAPVTSTLTRAQVRQQTLAAAANGSLFAVGEEAEYSAPQRVAYSTLTRAEVKSEVIAAQRAGELSPAGEEEFAVASHAPSAYGSRAAASQGAFSRFAAKIRGTNQ